MKDKDELINVLIQNYQQQLSQYEKILKYNKKQYNNLVNDDFTEITELNKQKEKTIKKIKKLQKSIFPSREQLAKKFRIKNNKNFISDLIQQNISQKKKLKKIAKEIVKVINEIDNYNQKIEKAIKEKKQNLQNEVKQLSTGKKLFNSYTTSSISNSVEGKFIDNEG